MRPILVITTEHFANYIRSFRRSLGWSREEFCRYFRMEDWMLERIETMDILNGFDIYSDSLCRIAKMAGVDMMDIIYGEDRPEC